MEDDFFHGGGCWCAVILLSSYFSAAEVLAAEYHRKSICEKMRDWLQSNKYEPWSFRRMWPLLLLLL